MNFEEYAAKPLLAKVGIAIPQGILCKSSDDVAKAAETIGSCVVKAQVPTGKRGKAGGIKLAKSPQDAADAADAILKLTIGDHRVEKLLVEAQMPIAGELYAAVLNDPATKGPLVLFSQEGGMDIEEIAENHPEKLMRLPVDIRHGIHRADLEDGVRNLGAGDQTPLIVDVLMKLYQAYTDNDAELIEINPLAVLKDGRLAALDCKFVLDDSAVKRREELAGAGTPDKLTGLEARAKDHGLKYIELDGTVGVLANGAGLTMTTMDAVRHYGGAPANFLEIGGEAYTLGKIALEIVLANPNVKSLLINFCGAFARTDVMAQGILEAWDEVKPNVPVFWSIHGTGEEEAIKLVEDKLGVTPYDVMDDAVKAAVEAAR